MELCRPSDRPGPSRDARDRPWLRPRPHRDFFAAGGIGLLIGDGQLNYRTEDILEAYYAWVIRKGLVTTFDYQFVNNPAYNADRGPVSIFSARVHAEW